MNKVIKNYPIVILMSMFGLVINNSYANTKQSLTCEQIKQVSSSFIQGNKYLENQKYQQSIQLFDRGIMLLNDSYFSPDVDDDTAAKLVLAEAEQKKGNLQNAAIFKGDVLSSRLDLTREDNPDCY